MICKYFTKLREREYYKCIKNASTRRPSCPITTWFLVGRIYLTCDRERTGAKEIKFLSFKEDIMDNKKELAPVTVSKP